MRAAIAVALLAVGVSCRRPAPVGPGGGGGRPVPAGEVALRPGEAAPPTLKLPAGFTPTRYRAELEIDPARPGFTGAIEIDATLAAATPLVWIHGDRLTVSSAEARIGGRVVALEPVPLDRDFLGLRARDPLPAGEVTLAIRYEGLFEAHDSDGAFVQDEGGAPYVFTQFQPTGARRVFPCVDEPWSKVPWALTLKVPAGQVALSNAPAAAEAVEGDRTVVRFADTAPLPTYLLAFAVGPFELVDGGTTPGGAPIRIAAYRGRGDEAAWAAEVTRQIVGVLEDWFGSPYPYAKLDSVPIPSTVMFSAMENAGLVTYRQDLLLLDEDASEDARRAYVITAAHELAHQWFGNLVTPAWWDDVWLNEGFATWMEAQVLARFSPAWSQRVPAVRSRSEALSADGLLSARRLREPIDHADEIETAFDTITYQKGAAVLHMFESWIGPQDFQAGVRAFVAAHAGGTATSDDFVRALDEASPLDVTAAFRSFLDQAGAPVVGVELRCEGKGSKSTASVALTQARWLPRGAAAPSGDPPRWQIPVCVAYGTAKTRQTTCTMLTGERQELPLTGTCPKWLLGNADARGYYRTAMSAEALDDLFDDGWRQVGPHERVLLADDVRAAVSRGELPITAELDLVPRLLRDGSESRQAIEIAVEIAESALAIVSAESRPALVAWIKERFGPRARKLGFLPDKGDGLDKELARAAILPLAGEVGREARLIERSIELSRKWETLSPPIRATVLRVAVIARPALADDLRAALLASADVREIEDLFDALSATDDPASAQASLALLLDPRVDLKQGRVLLTGLAARPSTQPVVAAFLREHFDTLRPRLPESALWDVALALTASCDPSSRADAATWLETHVAPLPGGTSIVPQSLEALDHCIARRAALAPALDAWLASR